MLFRPNTTCKLHATDGVIDVYGQQGALPGRVVPCAVVTYDLSRQKSSVRADSSGSRGRAEELAGVARFLFPAQTVIKRGDKIEKDGFFLEVIEIHPRYSVAGRLDHKEVDMRKAVE